MVKGKKEEEDEDFDPRRLFDEKEFKTLYVNREGYSEKPFGDSVIDRLVEPSVSREEQESLFAELKKKDMRRQLVQAIGSAGEDNKRILLAACWESGLDFSEHFKFFAGLVLEHTFEVALEAFTVIQQMESDPAPEDVSAVLKQIRITKEHNNAMVAELLSFLETKPH